MIEIKADCYRDEIHMREHVYINEKRISMISAPLLEKESFKTSNGWIDRWCFGVIIDGCSQKFCYLSLEECSKYYKTVFDAINLDA